MSNLYDTDTPIDFTRYLLENGHLQNGAIDKKVMQNLYKNYMAINNTSLSFSNLLFTMQRIVFLLKRKKKKDNGIISFRMNAVPRILQRYHRGNKNAAAANKVSPKKTKLVSQGVAFPTQVKIPDALTPEKCNICDHRFNNKNEFDKHTSNSVHKLREIYRTNKKALIIENKDINIKTECEGMQVEVIKAPVNSKNTIQICIQNMSNNVHEVKDIILLYNKLKEIEFNYNLPINLIKNASYKMTMKFSFENEGSYLLPIVFVFNNKELNKSFNIFKELIIRIQSSLVDELETKIPYKRKQNAVVALEEYPIIDGVRPESTPKGLKYLTILGSYKLPIYLIRILNSGFKYFRGMTPQEQEHSNELKKLLCVNDRSNCLTVENYYTMLNLLLFIEEHQMQKDIHDYDCRNQKLLKIRGKPKLLLLEVPGLAESRPSLVKGDSLLATVTGGNTRYRGYVHHTRQTSVELGFFNRFLEEIHQEIQSFDINFEFNRYTLRTEHQAIELINNHKAEQHFFPRNPPKSPNIINTQFVWFEQRILQNKEQQQAVRHIISRSAYPAPYLLFGPPGTGKTMTLVEAILQIWKTKPKCNILVAAPSNSAANEVTSRLIKYVPTTDLFRMISSTFAYEKISDNINKYCNYSSGDYYYPAIEEIMCYRIVIVTLTAAARLVNAEIPPKHFSYVFIDESGHSTESEVLIPIAGILTSKKDRGNMLGQIVLAGDPKQLGPIIHSKLAKTYGFGTSMLERLMTTNVLYKKDVTTDKFNQNLVTKLLNNYRSHPAILKLPNEMFYDEELEPLGNELVDIALDWQHLPNKNFPIIFHSVEGIDGREENSPSYFNLQEVDVVMKYLGYLIGNRLKGKKIVESDIGIVSPYRKQVQKIQLACKKKHWDILTGSVEQFQGQERLIIIISTVRSTQKLVQEDYRFHLGFLKNPKRFNVAVTRAKALLIVIGNPNILQCDRHWGKFIKYCLDNKATTGKKFDFKPMWTDATTDLAEDFMKLSLECNTASREHADFSRGII